MRLISAPHAKNVPESRRFRASYSKLFDHIVSDAPRRCATISVAMEDGISGASNTGDTMALWNDTDTKLDEAAPGKSAGQVRAAAVHL